MGLYKSTDIPGLPLNVGYAEDVGQLVDVLSGVRDAGALSLLAPLASPLVPTVSLSAGAITGTGYQWAVYWITGILDGTNTPHVTGRTAYGMLTGAQSLTAQQATISIGTLAPPTGAIGWGVARNKSPGGTTSAWYTVPGSEQFLSSVGTMPSSFVDDVVDASLVTLAPTVNTTGTSLVGNIADVIAFGKKTASVSTTGTTFGTGADVLASALSFIADGTSSYVVKVYAVYITNSTTGSSTFVNLNLDGADGGLMAAESTLPTGGGAWPLMGQTTVTPAAGAHTVNCRVYVSGNTGTVAGGTGGAAGTAPILVTVQKL